MPRTDATPLVWDDSGWLRNVAACPSPNFGPRPPGVLVDLLVVHCISLPPGQYGGTAVLDFFQNRLDASAHPYFQEIAALQVSAHFFVRRDGHIWQCVSADARAWHAGVSRYLGREGCNDHSIGIELEGVVGEGFDARQYASLAALCNAARQRYPIAHVAGHEHIAPGRKDDPGPGFDWVALQKRLGWPLGTFPNCAG
ncbi:MAG: 1,6-anhydro-N-acetylmuramyl-L-alanine amidase AmpD [Rhodoferax sp.]